MPAVFYVCNASVMATMGVAGIGVAEVLARTADRVISRTPIAGLPFASGISLDRTETGIDNPDVPAYR